MKYTARFLTFLLSLFLCIAVLIGAVAAEEASSLKLRRSLELTELQHRYELKDPIAGSATKNVIRLYRDKVEDIPSTNDTGWQVDAYYYQGVSAAVLAWIYYSHPEVHPSATQDPDTHPIFNLYQSELAAISGYDASTRSEEALQCFFLGDAQSQATVTHAYTRLLNAIYAQKISLLAQSGDSDATRELLRVAALRLSDPSQLSPEQREDALNHTPSFESEDALNYKSYLAYVDGQARAQRNRDAIVNQLSGIYRVLYPEVNFSSLDELSDQHGYIKSFLKNLSATSGISDLNALLNTALGELLNEAASAEPFYTKEYLKNTLLTKVSTTIFSATVNGRVAELIDSCFSDSYRLERARAKSKDTLVQTANEIGNIPETLLPIRDALIREYTEGTNGEAAIFDLCVTVEELSDTLACAKVRTNWFAQYLSSLEFLNTKLSKDLSAAQAKELTERAESQYLQTDAELRQGNQAALADGQAILSELIYDAEAQAFLNRHPIVLSIPTPITVSHKAALAAAIGDAAELSSPVWTRLEQHGRLSAISEAYRKTIEQELRKALPLPSLSNEAHAALHLLTQNSIYELCATLQTLSAKKNDGTWNFDAFLSETELLVKKANALGSVLAFCCDRLLSRDALGYAESMQIVCQATADQILSNTTVDVQSLADQGICALERLLVLEQIRDYALSHGETTDILAILSEAETALLPDSNQPPAQLSPFAENMFFRIDNCVLVQALEEKLDDLSTRIDEMKFLSSTDRDAYHLRSQALQEHIDAIRSAADRASQSVDVDSHHRAFLAALSQLWADTNAEELRNKKSEAKNAVTKSAEDLSAILQAYEFIEQADRTSFAQALQTLLSKSLQQIDSCTELDSVDTTLNQALEQLSDFVTQANQAEQDACLKYVKAELEEYRSVLGEYSAQNALQIQDTVLESLRALEGASGVSEYVAVYKTAKDKLDAVPTLAKEGRDQALAQLKECYDSLLEQSAFYSNAARMELAALYEESKSALGNENLYQKASDLSALRSATEAAIESLRAIMMDRVETDKSSPIQGSISASNAIRYDATLTIRLSSSDLSKIQKQIRESAKKKQILATNGSSLDASLLRFLRHAVISSGLSFEVAPSSLADSACYEVSVRLSDTTNLKNLLGIVFVKENGEVEFYEIDELEGPVSFSTTHFSDYYLVCAKVVNLTPVILSLAIFVLAELAVLLILYWRRSRRAAGMTCLPMAFPLAAVRYRPVGGSVAVILLGVSALLLAGWIVALLIAERRLRKPKSQIALPEVAVPIPISALAEIPSSSKSKLSLSRTDEPLLGVTAEEANALMSDELALSQAQCENDQVDPEIYHGSRRATVNLDTIAAHFDQGDTVTLNSLKAKGLLPKNVGFVKILARGRLDKPLTVLAQDFSTAAIKMILLTGGTPIRTHSSEERKQTKK